MMNTMPVVIGRLVCRSAIESRHEFGVIVAQSKPRGKDVRIKILWLRHWENDLAHGFIIDKEMFANGVSVLNQMLVDLEK